MTAQITDFSHARAFLLAGRATFTLVSKATGTRYTFKLSTKLNEAGESSGDGFWVRTLVGPDNTSDYVGCGFLATGDRDVPHYFPGKSKGKPQAAAIEWFLREMFVRREVPTKCELWHEGKCGRCGRKLTVPASIASGLGPECAGKVGFIAEAC